MTQCMASSIACPFSVCWIHFDSRRTTHPISGTAVNDLLGRLCLAAVIRVAAELYGNSKRARTLVFLESQSRSGQPTELSNGLDTIRLLVGLGACVTLAH
ncbi:hypothetical protein CRM22_003292 [Opisthorchis felineus]|uniref:Uncharacterized protein n=1 Tax=Opisthorchis felineus TaxID=147828 RepID=A0A4S2M206_OPIFE|nr:hypothetical protein CRM22_003292 [Opisthorchis felineus]